MTPDEKMIFCGTLCLAARRLGIYGRFQDDGFMWFDPMANRMRWLVPFNLNKIETLVDACNSLVNYLQIK